MIASSQASKSLDDNRRSTSSTITDGRATVSLASALQLVSQRGDQTSSRCTVWSQKLHLEYCLEKKLWKWWKESKRRQKDTYPIGWPRETPPPLTLTLLLSKPRSLMLTRATTEKASLTSQKSISSILRPALFKATGIARAGARGKSTGAVSASPYANNSARAPKEYYLGYVQTMRAKGFNLCCWAYSALVTMRALAPSFKVEALAAVTVPRS